LSVDRCQSTSLPTITETGRYLGGDAIEFYRRLRGLDFSATVDELAGLDDGRSSGGMLVIENYDLSAPKLKR
jgi:hypothetical protein